MRIVLVPGTEYMLNKCLLLLLLLPELPMNRRQTAHGSREQYCGKAGWHCCPVKPPTGTAHSTGLTICSNQLTGRLWLPLRGWLFLSPALGDCAERWGSRGLLLTVGPVGPHSPLGSGSPWMRQVALPKGPSPTCAGHGFRGLKDGGGGGWWGGRGGAG